MFRNNFNALRRIFRKNKVFSFINVTGLALGISSCLLIALYVYQQVSFDNFQSKGDRIARVIMQYSFEGSDVTNAGTYTSIRVPKVMKQQFPEVEDAVILTDTRRIVHHNGNLLSEDRFYYASPAFFKVFSFPLIEGDRATVLSNPHNVVITQSAASKYFGTENPVGKTLRLTGDSSLYKITGVSADCPVNSQIQYDFVASFSSLGISPEHESSYWDANYTTYLLLRDKQSIKTLQSKLPVFMKNEMVAKHANINFLLEPMKSVHLYSPYDAFVPNVGISYIYILCGVAILILIIACFTYINLSTASSVERAREISIRKVTGATRSQIFWQFIGESALISILAVIIGLVLTVLVLPYFEQIAGQALLISSLFSMPVLLICLGIIFIVSFAAGSYPALVLSSFLPAKVLKGAFKNSASGQWLRQSLIVFQFVISVFLIAGTFIIHQQLSYVQNKQLGYDRDHVLALPVPYMYANASLLKSEFKQDAGVMNVARCGNSPVNIVGGYSMYTPDMPPNSQIAVTANPVDDEFAPAIGLHFLAGTNLTDQDMRDVANESEDSLVTYHYILNESAAAKLGWSPREAIGKKMFLDPTRPGYVRGVVKDFHFQSLHKPIEPVVLFSSTYGSNVLIRLAGSNIPGTITFIQSKWKSIFPDRPFNYHFLDDDYNKLYQNDLRLGRLMNIFAAIAILLACIGLFGLSAYSVKQRVKEIGIRKILGAGEGKILILLSKDFVRLALIAILIALPLCLWIMHEWLNNFAYRTRISWWVPGLTILVTLSITLITISFQSIKAAISNPVKNLRTE